MNQFVYLCFKCIFVRLVSYSIIKETQMPKIVPSAALVTSLLLIELLPDPLHCVVPMNFAFLHGSQGTSSFDSRPRLFQVPTGHKIPLQPKDKTSKSLATRRTEISNLFFT